jgi:FdhD protein
MVPIHVYCKGSLEPDEALLPAEFPLNLSVNNREIATLIASPHDLRFLVAGFLRLQGFVEVMDDFLALSVCQDSGIASALVRKELPERLKPVLTSGCGGGVSFAIPASCAAKGNVPAESGPIVTPAAIFSAMDEMAKKAHNYKLHGGIHSAAVAAGDGTLLLYAEDIGRHNTIDRLAGEALFRGIDLSGRMLITSGRISSEMAAKAALLDVSLIASRTSPTDMAVKICEKAGITLAGYVRGGKFNVYAHSEKLGISAG